MSDAAILRQTIGDLHKHVRTPVLLAAMDVRRYTKKLVENEFETLPVLSYQELTPEVTVQPIARVALGIGRERCRTQPF